MPRDQVAAQQGSEDTARMSAGAIAALSGLVLLVVFMFQNTERVTVKFLFWDLSSPVWVMTLTTTLVGALVWFGIGVVRRRGRR